MSICIFGCSKSHSNLNVNPDPKYPTGIVSFGFLPVNPNWVDSSEGNSTPVNVVDSTEVVITQFRSDSIAFACGNGTYASGAHDLQFYMPIDTFNVAAIATGTSGQLFRPATYDILFSMNGEFFGAGINTYSIQPTNVIYWTITGWQEIKERWFLSGTFSGEFKMNGLDKNNNPISAEWRITNGIFTNVKWVFPQ